MPGDRAARAAAEPVADREIVITPQMIEAGARIIADQFDLEMGGYSAERIAELVLREAFLAKKQKA